MTPAAQRRGSTAARERNKGKETGEIRGGSAPDGESARGSRHGSRSSEILGAERVVGEGDEPDEWVPPGSAPTGKEKEEEQSGLARWKSSVGPRRTRIRPKVSFSLFFFIVSIFLSYFHFKSNQVLISKFQIYAQEKLHMMHNYYILFLHLFYYYIN
jgi:hypothetical protein